MLRYLAIFVCAAAIGGSSATHAADAPPSLTHLLAQEPVADLAKAARARGDAARGAMLFFQGFLTCARCHDGGEQLGPDLSKISPTPTAEHLIESVLAPSKVLKSGYEPLLITTHDGRSRSGRLLEENAERLTLLDPVAGNVPQIINKSDIASRTAGKQSLMPEGLVNALSDRQQFLDLAKYLIEIAEQGPTRAAQLRPVQRTLELPEYERNIDHAGMIRALDADAFARGEAIYARVCANCHGTREAPGSLPTSLRFAEGAFKNGSDPHSLYQTLTRGYGQMAAQTWMVPRQKYDVIHYLREAYLKPHNPSQFVPANDEYLARLPKGTTFGPDPSTVEAWAAMDYGPSLINTYEVGPEPNFAYKGIAVRLDPGHGGVSRGRQWAIFDHDTLRMAAAWTGDGFIDWMGIHFNGQHQVHPKLKGEVHLANPAGPGWANPDTGSFEDPRLAGRDGRRYGPLPAPWAKYLGVYHYGDQSIISYQVGRTRLFESYGAEQDPSHPQSTIFVRNLEVPIASQELTARIAPAGVAVALVGESKASLVRESDFTLLKIPASEQSQRIKLLLARLPAEDLAAYAKQSPPPRALQPLTEGGPKRWPDVLTTSVARGADDGPFAVDTFALPENNPWHAQLRLTGFDFYPDGKRMAVCTWDGDVWEVSGLGDLSAGLSWRRIASGLFQPLGLKFRFGQIFVCCRDQIARLVDLNGDGETDFTECLNNDHQVTEHFHEFAMGLQTDRDGNFYYAKSGRHALPALVPHHGTLLKVSADGQSTEILATGFRAANGVCLNPDGTFFVTDQEGFWTPKNRINRVQRGGFYGNLFGYTDITDQSDSAMQQPLCWITNDFDRSPAELLWVESDRWGPLAGSLLNLSYGHGKIYIVPHEKVDGQAQGGMCAVPLPEFPTGIMRGRFHPADGQLYACGMFAWAGNRTQPGGFYRIRATGKPMDLPLELKAKSNGVELSFTDPVDVADAANVANYAVRVWDLKRSENYGSKHINERSLPVRQAQPSADGKSVRLTIDGIAPTWGMEIAYRLKGPDGRSIARTIHNSIHKLPAPEKPRPVKVFILAGQSNMEGQAVVDLDGKDYNDGKGTLRALFADPNQAARFKHLKTGEGAWAERKDVWVRYQREDQPPLAGPLKIGYSVYGDEHHFGPELQLGHLLGERLDEQVLLIKTAWGGRSLYQDFRPPSAGGKTGPYYTRMVSDIRAALANLKTDFPDYADQGYELAGLVWYHGWNDGVDPQRAVPEYESNLAHLIRDLRREFKSPGLPVVIGELTGPWVDAPQEWEALRAAQSAVANRPRLKDRVKFVRTRDFVRRAEDSPNPGHGHHEFGNAETYLLVGDALARGMLELLEPSDKGPPDLPKPTSRTTLDLEGWKIRVDDRLLQGPDQALGIRSLRFLEAKLAEIKLVAPPDKVKKLQAMTIVLDLTHGKLTSMQYHPGADWLRENGYAEDLVKCVHIPQASDLATKRSTNEQPWVILHELAHAYHDQVLSFHHPGVKKAYENYKASGRGEKTLLYNGERVKHYALTNPQEFFAEMTESYFGSDDFYPFNRAELKESEPEIYNLMVEIWGPLP